MKLQSASPDGQNLITAYGDDHVAVNGVIYRNSLIVGPLELSAAWSVSDVAGLDTAAIEFLAQFANRIVILGTGNKQRFPSMAILREFKARGMAVEVMDTHAACRTYNILMTEGRNVIAALMISPATAAS